MCKGGDLHESTLGMHLGGDGIMKSTGFEFGIAAISHRQ
jgi:hypothetical protein